MLPFFRKIRWRLAQDNQFFKYSRYAIGEIVLVVIGILIAIQVNNWNEEKKDQKEELKALNDLATEFQINHQNILNLLNLKTESELEMRKYIKKIVSDSLSMEQKINLDRPDYSGHNLATNYSILKSLLNSGALDKFRNDSLKQSLSNWGDRISYYKEYEQRHNEFVIPNVDAIESITIQGKLIQEKSTGLQPTLDYVHPKRIEQNKAALVNNLAYENALIGVINSLWIKNQILTGILMYSDYIQKQLDKEIDKRTS